MKNLLKRIYKLFNSLLFDPLAIYRKWRALPHFIRNIFAYKSKQQANSSFKISTKDFYFTTADKFQSSGNSYGHYFLQDLWAANKVHQTGVKLHIDVASRIDGFVAHLLPFCKVEYVDIRPMESKINNLTYVKGDICNLPYESNSVESLSCLHVLEHIGLGRYGDDIDPDGHIKGAKELARILKPGGTLYFGTPVGRERLCFDAHRVFKPETIVKIFGDLKLVSFSLIDDKAEQVFENVDLADGAHLNYGCGLYVFTK